MPNRIIREGILTSERVNSLNWEEEVFFRRLLSVVDDFGRCEAHAALLRASLFPLKLDQVREANVERLLAACERARLVRLYEVDSKRFLEVCNFRQQTRSSSKHPSPSDAPMRSTCAADARQLIANAHLGVSVSVVEGGVGRVPVGPPASVPEPSPASPGRKASAKLDTLAEALQLFATLGGSELDAAAFFDHYAANGWRQSNGNRIVDVRAAARSWIRRSGGGPSGGAAGLGGGGPRKNLGRGGGGAVGYDSEPRVSLPIAGLDEAMAEEPGVAEGAA